MGGRPACPSLCQEFALLFGLQVSVDLIIMRGTEAEFFGFGSDNNCGLLFSY